MAEQKKVLILGGTREAADLARKLVGEGHDVTTSLAGRTSEPAPLAGKTRTGGFSKPGRDGAEALADYLSGEKFSLLIDATHPFATRISANAQKAAKLTGIPFEIHARKPWRKEEGDNWSEVTSIIAARDAIPAKARVLLALGSQHIEPFGERNDVCFVVRMVDPPEKPLPLRDHRLVLGRPSRDWREEMALLKEHAITHIVCRNSGGTGAYAKIMAARAIGLPVIIIGRPAPMA